MLPRQCRIIIGILVAQRACVVVALHATSATEAKKSRSTFLQRVSDEAILGESREAVTTHLHSTSNNKFLQRDSDEAILGESREVVPTKLHSTSNKSGGSSKAVQSQSMYSTHECQGDYPVSYGSDVHNTSCRFRNVCFPMAMDAKSLIYFQDSQIGINHKELQSLDMRPISNGANEAVRLPIHFLSGPIPQGASFWPVPITVLFQPFGSENFGHQLGDNMFAVYSMQQLFQIADPYNSQLIMMDRCDRPEADGQFRTACHGMMSKMYKALSRHPVLQLRAADLMRHGTSTTKLMCFHTLIAGSGAHSYRSPKVQQLSGTFFNFRSFLITNAVGPCTTVACNDIPTGRTTIIISKKSSWNPRGMGPGIQNVAEIQLYLSRVFPESDVLVRDFATLSFGEQLALAKQTKIMFSHPGGGSFTALFLPPGATLAISSHNTRTMMTAANLDFLHLELRFWQSLSWLTLHDISQDLTPYVAEQIVHKARQYW